MRKLDKCVPFMVGVAGKDVEHRRRLHVAFRDVYDAPGVSAGTVMKNMSDLEIRPELAPVRGGEELDWDRLAQYLTSHIDGLQGEMEVLRSRMAPPT